MAAFVFKIFTLAVRTAAKPLAVRFQQQTLAHPTFRQYCINVAQSATAPWRNFQTRTDPKQTLHRLEVRISRGAEGKTQKAFVGDLTEDKALELASKFVSEGFVFAVGAAVIGVEYTRQRQKDLAKKAVEDEYRRVLDERYEEEKQALEQVNEQQARMMANMAARMEQLEQQVRALQGGASSGVRQGLWLGW